MMKTEEELKDIILAWAIRKSILLRDASVHDLAKEIARQQSLPESQ